MELLISQHRESDNWMHTPIRLWYLSLSFTVENYTNNEILHHMIGKRVKLETNLFPQILILLLDKFEILRKAYLLKPGK